jgi:hypothetical protein
MNIIGGRNDTSDKHRKLYDGEIKELFINIKLNTHFSLPERLVQDFIQDGSIKPTFKKCIHFNKDDLNDMINLIKQKNIKKISKRKNTKKKKAKQE